MRLEDYTNDNICTALGIGPFHPIGAEPVIRLLLKPSFHPETCITLEPRRLYLAALETLLWHQESPRHMQGYTETIEPAEGVFGEMRALFEQAADENGGDTKKWITVDGMPVSAVLVDGKYHRVFHGNPHDNKQTDFVARMIRFAHTAAETAYLRNRIAWCGWYVGEKFAEEPEAYRPQVSRMMVLGEAEARAEYFEMLRNKYGKKESK